MKERINKIYQECLKDVVQTEEYLFGEKPNYVKATLALNDMVERYGGIRYSDVGSWVGMSAGDVCEEAKSLLNILKEGKNIDRSSFVDIRKYLEDYASRCEAQSASDRATEAQNARYYSELEDQRWRENHRDHWTGDSYPNGPC